MWRAASLRSVVGMLKHTLSIAALALLAPAPALAADKTETLRFFTQTAALTLTHADGTVVDKPPFPEPVAGDVLDAFSARLRRQSPAPRGAPERERARALHVLHRARARLLDARGDRRLAARPPRAGGRGRHQPLRGRHRPRALVEGGRGRHRRRRPRHPTAKPPGGMTTVAAAVVRAAGRVVARPVQGDPARAVVEGADQRLAVEAQRLDQRLDEDRVQPRARDRASRSRGRAAGGGGSAVSMKPGIAEAPCGTPPV